MSLGLSEIASTLCKDKCKDKSDNNNILWILIIVVLVCCCGKNFIGGNCDPCGPRQCGINNTGGLGGSGIWILLFLLIFCSGNGGIGGTGRRGNTNTNIIRLDTNNPAADDYDDYIDI